LESGSEQGIFGLATPQGLFYTLAFKNQAMPTYLMERRKKI